MKTAILNTNTPEISMTNCHMVAFLLHILWSYLFVQMNELQIVMQEIYLSKPHQFSSIQVYFCLPNWMVCNRVPNTDYNTDPPLLCYSRFNKQNLSIGYIYFNTSIYKGFVMVFNVGIVCWLLLREP